ncbi:MAG: hypothetical protein FJY29_10170 [Betaproteobacteria bacterium]|nr:hypothetical protein [Betaproteobacteria bacterium]
MNTRTHAQRFRGGVLLYALSVASGLANFGALKLLQHITPQPSTYSQISTILLSFTTFQLLTDLGTQTQFVHSFRKADAAHRGELVHLLLQSRLALGCAAVLLSLVYIAAAQFTAEMAFAFLLYQVAFIPFAYMSTADSVFLAREEFSKAILSRVTRIVALICFLTVAAITHSGNLIMPALFSTVSFCICAVLVWFSSLRESTTSTAGHAHFLKPSWWRFSNSAKLAFLKGSGLASLVIIFHFLQSFIAQIFLVRSVGEQSLTSINTALVIATPAILAFQTLGQMQLPAVSDWASSREANLKPDLLKFFLKMLLVFVLMCAGLALAQELGWVSWFFPLSTQTTVELSFLYMIANAILCFAGPLQVLCQYQSRARPLLLALAISVLLSWACQFILNPHSNEMALLTALLLFAVLISTASLIISTQRQSRHLD